MKQLILTATIITICTFNYAQTFFEPFDGRKTVSGQIGLFSSGAIINDGFNIGIQTVFNFTNGVYIAPEAFYFPDLRNNSYFHIGSSIGYNFIYKNNFRVYSGITLLFTHRENYDWARNGSIGFTAGVEYYIPTTSLYVGIDANYQNRNEIPSEPNYWQYSTYVKIGARIF